MLKRFFAERSSRAIKALGPKRVYTRRGLVERVMDLAPEEAVELRLDLHPPASSLEPPDFASHKRTGAERSRMVRKRGETLNLPTRTLERAMRERKSIMDDLLAALPRLGKPGEGRGIGYRFKPVRGADRVTRYVFWDDLADGQRLAHYAALHAPIRFETQYELDGVVLSCTIPHKERKRQRYRYSLFSVPKTNGDAHIVARSIKPGLIGPQEARRPTIAHYRNLRARAPGNEGLQRVILVEQDIAVYAAYMLAQAENPVANPVPFAQRPFAYFSAPMLLLDDRLRNNVIIYDPTIAAKDNPEKLRKLHEEERARVLGWGVAKLRERAFASLDELKREIFKPSPL